MSMFYFSVYIGKQLTVVLNVEILFIRHKYGNLMRIVYQ